MFSQRKTKTKSPARLLPVKWLEFAWTPSIWMAKSKAAPSRTALCRHQEHTLSPLRLLQIKLALAKNLYLLP